MRPIGDPKRLEARRYKAVSRVEIDGWTVAQAAREAKVNPRTAERWLARYRDLGEEALKATVATGRPCEISQEQLKKLETILLAGALANGFPTDLWTRERVAEVIDRQFGVSYHPGHVSRILQKMGWSVQKPAKQAAERDDIAIQQWVKNDWPKIKKKPRH